MYGNFGWRSHTVFNPDKRSDAIKPFVLPPLGSHPSSIGIGALGIAGYLLSKKLLF